MGHTEWHVQQNLWRVCSVFDMDLTSQCRILASYYMSVYGSIYPFLPQTGMICMFLYRFTFWTELDQYIGQNVRQSILIRNALSHFLYVCFLLYVCFFNSISFFMFSHYILIRNKKAVDKTNSTDDKRLQSTLKRIGVNTIPCLEGVHIFRDDSVIQFANPKDKIRNDTYTGIFCMIFQCGQCKLQLQPTHGWSVLHRKMYSHNLFIYSIKI